MVAVRTTGTSSVVRISRLRAGANQRTRLMRPLGAHPTKRPTDRTWPARSRSCRSKATPPVAGPTPRWRRRARLRVALGNVALRQGDREAALDSGRRALALEPSNADAQALVRAAGG